MLPIEKIHDLALEEVIGDRFGRYSKYIIQERALPDARDGLKPVQRRILYAMYAEGNTSDKAFRKSAKTVGNVIGNYHPHGDSSVYEAMVRMSQDWKVRNVLVEMHGNNGSMDGDSPAAMRYTEARLSAISTELLRDIDKETVEFIPNFDDTSEEPTVLPAMFPNLLVNGSTGISAGYATEIPPHHLGEVIDGVIHRIDNQDCSVSDLMNFIKGPDFPTGGIVQGIDGIKKAYETGRGKIIIRGKVEIEQLRGGREQIAISEIPFEVNKANLVKKIDEIRVDKKLDGIIEVRDETDRTGLRIVVELKKDANTKNIENYLYKNTDLQVAYNFNMVAIYDKHPKQMSLTMMLDAYIKHQKEVVTKRSKYDLKKAEHRLHIVHGLKKAISMLDVVIATIRSSKDKKDAKERLIERFEFTEIQAEAIVMLQLYKLTNTDITSLEEEASMLEAKIKELQSILQSERVLSAVIKQDLKRVKKTFANPRRSVIEDQIEEIKINLEAMIPQEDVVVSVTKEGYIKRTSPRSYNASNGKDIGMKERDAVIAKFDAVTTDTLLVFTNKGNYIYLPVHELPDIRWKDLGHHLGNIVPIENNEIVIHAELIKEFEDNRYLLFVTKQGMVKKSELKSYKVTRYSKPVIGINCKNDDEVISVHNITDNGTIMIVTNMGYALRFDVEEVNLVGVKAAGVKGISLKEEDYVVGSIYNKAEDDKSSFVLVTQRGAVKRIKVSEIDKTTRAKRGFRVVRELKEKPHLIVGAKLVTDEFDLLIQTEKQDDVFKFMELKLYDRFQNGQYLIDTEETGAILSVLYKEKI